MKPIIADANAFLRFILNDNPDQKKVFNKLLQQAKQDKITLIVPHIVIFEMDFILEKYYEFSKEAVIERLQPLVSTKYLQVDDREVFMSALKIYSSVNISFVDCFLLAKATLEEAKLFTFDKKLENLT